MAEFKRHQEPTTTFKERRSKGRVVAFHPDIVAEPRPSPARILQESLARQRHGDPYVSETARRTALAKFIGTAVLLWGAMAVVITVMMVAAS